MIVKCIDNKIENIPNQYLAFGPDHTDNEHCAVSIDKYYIVFAERFRLSGDSSWYFVYTDNAYLWWMPSILFDSYDMHKPAGWQADDYNETRTLSYPSLHKWSIEEGIIDGEKEALNVFMEAVSADKSFPDEQYLASLNDSLVKRQAKEQYDHDLAIAKENGWEWPEKPSI